MTDGAAAGVPGVPSVGAQRAVRDRCRHPTGTFTPFRPEDIEQSVPARFVEQVRRHPGRVAVTARDGSLTYAALNRAANRVARALGDRGVSPGRPIALLFEHGAAAIVGMLGVLKAGFSTR